MNMTPDQIEQWKDACDALRDGERIQVNILGTWDDTDVLRSDLPHRRKPKPDPWTLPPPPAGQEWHRTDWTEDMLPEGWRPLLYDEIPQFGDEVWKFGEGPWGTFVTAEPRHSAHNHTRTMRPLPTPPRMVPLTRADVPFGSVFRALSGSDFLPVQTSDHGITLALHGESGFRGWTHLQSMGWLIHRPGDIDADAKPVFRRCEKEEKK